MSFLRDLLYEPVTLRFLLLTLAFVFMAVAFVLRLVSKEDPVPPPRHAVPQRAPLRAVADVAGESAQETRQSATLPGLQQPREIRTEIPTLPAAEPAETTALEPEARSAQVDEAAVAPAAPPDSFSFEVLQNRPSFVGDLLRGGLAILALVVLGAFIIVVLPQGAFDRLADGVRIRKGPVVPRDMIALLYLGEEAKGTDFHIRGVVRNILSRPVEQLDANVRLYAPDRTLLESAIVRMDVELIPPDATASFHLIYPDYRGQFGSYSIDFKLRPGDPVPYKDMRSLRTPE